MSNLKLAKTKLAPGVIDVAIGEPYIVREALLDTIDLPHGLEYDFTYPCSGGYEPLVEVLEKRHQGRVVITNGAKQALSAVFAIMSQNSIEEYHLRSPYWTLIPPLSQLYKVYGMDFPNEASAALSVIPNNPDGYLPSKEELVEYDAALKENNIFHVHDAVYYNNIYTSPDYEKFTFGDCQIYSFAKLWGLSGLRVGYIVTQDEHLHDQLRDYVEATTSGVSVVAQEFALDIYKSLLGTKEEFFMEKARKVLVSNRLKAKDINPEVLLPGNIETQAGMFLWAKKGPMLDLDKAQINAIDGEHFGAPGFIRMNLGIEPEVMDEVVRRLNELT